MLKKITLLLIAILLMMNMYIEVIYAAQNTTDNQVKNQNVTGNQTQSENKVSENKTSDNTTEASTSEESSSESTETNVEEPVNKVVESTAKVIEAGEVKKVANGSIEDTIQTIKLEILDGEYKAKEFTTDYVLSYDIEGKILAHELNEGDKITVQINEDKDGSTSITIEGFQRANYIYTMFAILLIVIIIIGGKQGIKAAISLIITILALYFVLIKSIFAGVNSIVASVVTSIVIISLTFIITIGLNKKSLSATIGSFLGTLFAGILAIAFGNLAKLSGATEEAIQLSLYLKTITFNFRQLIFASIVISSIGACMDIAVSIVNDLDEIRSKTQDFTLKELFKKGMQYGREVIGTMSNTLILVYIGGIIKLILLYMACNMEMTYIMSKEAAPEQIISALAGSIGVILTVPITSLVYAIINRKKTVYKTVSDNKIEGKRSLKI